VVSKSRFEYTYIIVVLFESGSVENRQPVAQAVGLSENVMILGHIACTTIQQTTTFFFQQNAKTI
jgi:hypothetical protein